MSFHSKYYPLYYKLCSFSNSHSNKSDFLVFCISPPPECHLILCPTRLLGRPNMNIATIKLTLLCTEKLKLYTIRVKVTQLP